jgi:glycosyltransferase involved in cell wall biosynthesis
MERKQKRIGVVRAFPRVTQAEYANSFSELKPVFISPKGSSELTKFIKKKNLEWRELPLEKVYGFDPVHWVLGKQSHQSWVRLQGLRAACQDLDVLETHELYFFDSGQVANIAKKRRVPLVVEVWTTLAKHLAYKLPPYSWTVEQVLKQADLFVARSTLAEKALLKLGVEKQKIKTIYYGVNLNRFYPSENLVPIPRVLFVGRLNKFKGVDLILDTWREISQAIPKAELWLVGEGELSKRAEKVKGVRVLGKVDHEKLPGIYRQAQVFVSLTRDRYFGPFKMAEEYFSHTLMEAQACGLPIVATRCGGIPEEIGDNNWLIEQNDKQALVSALLEVLTNEQKRKRVGQENRERAESLYDLKKQVAKLETEILKIC